MKKMNDEIRYRYPIVLWSVEVIHLTTVRPSVCRCGARPGIGGSTWLPRERCRSPCQFSFLWVPGASLVPLWFRFSSTPERAGLAPLAQVVHLGVELLARDDRDVEQHGRVLLAAELGALAGVDALTRRG